MLALSLELAQHQFEQNPALSSVPIGEPIGILVLLGFAAESIWRLARHISVIAHEGAHAIVLQRVDRDGGRIRIGGEEWSARAFMDDQVFEPGARVEVMKIEGATALVYE